MNNNNKEELNQPKIQEEIPDENNNLTNNQIENNNIKDSNNNINNNNISNPKIKQENINELEISAEEDFLEKSLINEIKQTITQLEHQCENEVGESAVETRCRILSYAIVLVDVYKKPKSNLIYPYTKLGEAYYDIKYYEQAREHFENAIKYNNDPENKKYQTLPEDYLIKLTIKLSRCYLEIKEYQAALQLGLRVLTENIKQYGENDISNVEIYDIIFQSEKNLEIYSDAIEHLKILNNYYNQIYDEKSDKCLLTKKEIAKLYELDKQKKEAITFYKEYFHLIEEVEIKDKIKEIFEISLKVGELHAELKEYKEAYDFLKKVDTDYNNGFNRTEKEKYVYQKFLCTLASYLNDNETYLKELLHLEKILDESKQARLSIKGKNYITIAHTYKTKKELDKSIEYYNKAADIFKNDPDGKLMAEINKAIKAIQKEKRDEEFNNIK
jgi:tetratricopeptide (TPR) repeat protein